MYQVASAAFLQCPYAMHNPNVCILLILHDVIVQLCTT